MVFPLDSATITAPTPSQADPRPRRAIDQVYNNTNVSAGVFVSKLLCTLNDASPPSLSPRQLAQAFRTVFQNEPGQVSACELLDRKQHLALEILRVKRLESTPTVSAMSSAPTLDRFLAEISRLLHQRDGSQLQDFLVIEPPFSDLYKSMITELRQSFPKGAEDPLEEKCSNALPLARDGDDAGSWTQFIKFMVQYFGFIRDVNVDNLLDTYNQLRELVQKCNSTLSHASLGVLVLPTVISFSRMLSKLAIGLDKQPHLIAHLNTQTAEEGVTETLPEKAANVIRQAFISCLNDRSTAVAAGQDPRLPGKKIGIYKIANLCLKVLYACKKTSNAEQIFSNIYNQAPGLSLFPRSQRVTYLYYLGRFWFSSNHFVRAQKALQGAYEQCHKQSTKQRRLILVFLLASNVILGRFPSSRLYQRTEAAGMDEIFQPICQAIARGDLASFHKLTSDDAPHADWLLHFRVLLQIRSRCEVLVWRSLARRVFTLTGTQGDGNRKAATLNLEDVTNAAQILVRGALAPEPKVNEMPGQRHTNWIFMQQQSPRLHTYTDPDLEATEYEDEAEPLLPDMTEVESVVSSLIQQGLMGGFISHKQSRFAILGARQKGVMAAGFPNVWNTIQERFRSDSVPGWSQHSQSGGMTGPRKIHLSGAQAVGVGS